MSQVCKNHFEVGDNEKRSCFNCLKKHDEGFSLAANCSFGSCKKCGGKHHTVLHKESFKNHDSQDNSPTKEKDVFLTDTNMSGNLKTFMGYVSDGSKTEGCYFIGRWEH